MLIDWFTVLAQIANFLILIWLLNRFLFKPIRGAMAQREKAMTDALNRAERAEIQAKLMAQELEKEKMNLENDRELLMSEARDQVARWREETIRSVGEEVENLRRVWRANMTRDRQAFLDGLKQRLVTQVVRIGEKALRDLADQRLNQQVLRVFLEKVSTRKDELNQRSANRQVRVQSGIPLESHDAQMLREQLSQWFPTSARIQIESAPDLGFGIQLVVGDRMAAWHLSDYLGGLEAEVLGNLFEDSREQL